MSAAVTGDLSGAVGAAREEAGLAGIGLRVSVLGFRLRV